jgi:hypothetical protein
MALITLKVKAKLYPWWHYLLAAILGFAGAAFYLWLACQLFAMPVRLAREAFIVYCLLITVFLALMHSAYRMQYRTRNPVVVHRIAVGFTTSLVGVTLYYCYRNGAFGLAAFGNQPTVRMFTLAATAFSILLGLFLAWFGIKVELQ